MEKNQKYTPDQMFGHIESWQKSGVTQYRYCKNEGLSRSTFGYWHKKYKQQTPVSMLPGNKPHTGFLPVEVRALKDSLPVGSESITITYPNGIQISCPLSLGTI